VCRLSCIEQDTFHLVESFVICVPLQGSSTQDEGIRTTKAVQWLPTYGCLFVLYPLYIVRIKHGAACTMYVFFVNVFGMTRPGFEPPTSQTQSKLGVIKSIVTEVFINNDGAPHH